MSERVLLVEDDPAVAELVVFHVERAGFDVVHAASVEAAWDRLEDADVLVLDRMLPGASGIEMVQRLRAGGRGRDLPVLLLTARASEADRVEGLEAGADDYLVKPFGAAELVARIRALLRRAAPAEARIELGELRVDPGRAEAVLRGRRLELTRREFDLLAFLAAHPGRVYSRGDLLDRVWGEDYLGTERTVDQHVAQLRGHLGDGWIETLRGRGYRLAPEPPGTAP